MKLTQGMEAYVPSGPTAATTGTFDGVHAGHLRILKRLQEVAHALNGSSVVVTFDPHPRKVIHPDFPLRLLTTLDERADLLETAGLDDLVVQPFTPAFAAWSSLDFVRRGLVEHLNVKRLVIGYDHHFGRNREGTFAHLQEFGPVYGFEVEEIPPHDVEAVRVSSTKIRTALESGDVGLAAQWLTRPYFCSGVVAHGSRLGRDLGYPTANVGSIDLDKLLPKDGVYAVWVERLDPKHRGERLPGVANLGVRPTVDGSLWQLEAHVLDVPVENLYGQELRVHFVARLRDEHRFPDTEALKAQIARDADAARAALRAAF